MPTIAGCCVQVRVKLGSITDLMRGTLGRPTGATRRRVNPHPRTPIPLSTNRPQHGGASPTIGPRLLPSYVLYFILLDNRRHQRERRCVMRCNECLAVNSAPIPYRGFGIALRFTSKSYKRRADERTRTADLTSLRVSCSTVQRGPQTFPEALANPICWAPPSVSRARKRSSGVCSFGTLTTV